MHVVLLVITLLLGAVVTTDAQASFLGCERTDKGHDEDTYTCYVGRRACMVKAYQRASKGIKRIEPAWCSRYAHAFADAIYNDHTPPRRRGGPPGHWQEYPYDQSPDCFVDEHRRVW